MAGSSLTLALPCASFVGLVVVERVALHTAGGSVIDILLLHKKKRFPVSTCIGGSRSPCSVLMLRPRAGGD
jgi:hypothetical protein